MNSSNSDSTSGNWEASNPYLLHNGDNPNTILVSPLLDNKNYFSWRRSMEIALGSKRKMNFVNGNLPRPAKSDPTYEDWMQCDLMISSWILNSCSKEVAPCVRYAESAAEMWRVLQLRYGQGNAPRLYELQTTISSLR